MVRRHDLVSVVSVESGVFPLELRTQGSQHRDMFDACFEVNTALGYKSEPLVEGLQIELRV